MKDKSKKSTYSTTFGVDPEKTHKVGAWDARAAHGVKACERFIYETKKPAKRLLKRA